MASLVVEKVIKVTSPFGEDLHIVMKTSRVVVNEASQPGPKVMRQMTLPKPIIITSPLMPSFPLDFKPPLPSLCISFPRDL